LVLLDKLLSPKMTKSPKSLQILYPLHENNMNDQIFHTKEENANGIIQYMSTPRYIYGEFHWGNPMKLSGSLLQVNYN